MHQPRRTRRPPVILTFLAPAERCNQRCPRCIIDVIGEPVRDFRLTPSDYRAFLDGFVKARIPIRAVMFQGYEVTLPSSWPYLEEVFSAAKTLDIRRSFITNGMLLDRWTERIEALDPARISVSIDGSTPEVHDPIRGLSGAFEATLRSVRAFLRNLPAMQPRIGIASSLYGETNFASLCRLPPLLRDLGIRRWTVVCEATVLDGKQQPAHSEGAVQSWFRDLAEAARAANIQFHVTDEFGHYRDSDWARSTKLPVRHVFDTRLMYRLYPAGFVRVGREFLRAWDEQAARRFRPGIDDPVDVVGYRDREAEPPASAEST